MFTFQLLCVTAVALHYKCSITIVALMDGLPYRLIIRITLILADTTHCSAIF
jgi:hypothetical protein